MSRSTNLNLSYWNEHSKQPWVIFNELVDTIEISHPIMARDVINNELTIPAEYQYIVFGGITFNADLNLNGTLVVL